MTMSYTPRKGWATPVYNQLSRPDLAPGQVHIEAYPGPTPEERAETERRNRSVAATEAYENRGRKVRVWCCRCLRPVVYETWTVSGIPCGKVVGPARYTDGTSLHAVHSYCDDCWRAERAGYPRPLSALGPAIAFEIEKEE